MPHAKGEDMRLVMLVLPLLLTRALLGQTLAINEFLASGASNQPTAVALPAPRSAGLELLGAQPNPFNPATTVRYRLAAPAAPRLRVLCLLGREVAAADLGLQPAGEGSWQWTPAPGLASGSYWLQLEAGGAGDTIKLLYIR
jgi:hypothetical protein